MQQFEQREQYITFTAFILISLQYHWNCLNCYPNVGHGSRVTQQGDWKCKRCKWRPPKSRSMKMQDMKMQDLKMLDTKTDGMKQLLTCSEVAGC